VSRLSRLSRLTLTQVLALAAGAVAVVAMLVAALLTTPLVRAATEDSARTALARQAELVARLPGARVAVQLEQRADARPVRQGLAVGVVTADGEVRGAAGALSDPDLGAVRAGRPVSGEATWRGQRVLLEARPLREGGSVVLATGARDVDVAVGAQRRRLLLALGVGLLVALGAGALVARQLGRPLATLAEGARRLGSGERGVVPAVGGTREVADVALALHQLDTALQHSEDRQRRFLMSVSHELRTPLTSVRGYAESMVDGAVEPAEMEAVGRTLLAESRRLERFIGDLLALARLEADDFELVAEDVDLSDLVRSAGATWQDRAQRAAVRLSVESPDEPLPVVTDPGRLRQVVDALVDNAVRVCPPGAVVVVSASAGDDGVRLEVRDSGPGLTAADAAVAFEPGTLHDRYAGQRPGGQGLGLAIVHRLVTRLGGSVRVTTAAEGGAAFVVELPRDGER
jgi:two-component system, OmpR family, sensor kinase